jgi:hypothetical protein
MKLDMKVAGLLWPCPTPDIRHPGPVATKSISYDKTAARGCWILAITLARV